MSRRKVLIRPASLRAACSISSRLGQNRLGGSLTRMGVRSCRWDWVRRYKETQRRPFLARGTEPAPCESGGSGSACRDEQGAGRSCSSGQELQGEGPEEEPGAGAQRPRLGPRDPEIPGLESGQEEI